MADLSLKWQDFDNYILVIAAFLTGIAGVMGNVGVAFFILGAGLIIKAIASAIDPAYTILQNWDNIALGIAGALGIWLAYTNNPTWALAIMIVGGFLKAVGSAYTRTAPLKTNIDNVVLAATTSLAAAAVTLGYPDLSLYIATFGAFIKGMLSTYFRNKATAATTPA